MLKYEEFSSAIALTNFVNEHKLKKEDVQKIAVNTANIGPYDHWYYAIFYWV